MRGTKTLASSLAGFVLALFANSSPAWADFVYSASNGSGLSASVKFEVSGGNLIVTLTNTSSSDVSVPSQILTAVFFNVPGSLTPISANVANGSVVNNPTAAGNAEFPNVAGEWGYKSGLSLNGANTGISSSGLGVFGPGDLFGSPNLDGPESPNGLQYGITSAGDDPTSGNAAVTSTALIQNSVVFTLSGWNSNWDLASVISNIWFQYGTSLSEPSLGVPEPGVLALLGVGLLGLVFGVRKMSWA